MARLLADPFRLCWLLAAISAGALAAAWAIEASGYAPCPLCLYQRYPYYLAVPWLALTAVVGWPRLGLAVAALLFLVDAGIAAWHSAVELGLLVLPQGCEAQGASQDLAELKAAILATVPRCDQPALTILGLSLANWNLILALALAGLALSGLWRSRRRSGGT
ncbi:Disulfide bond formation protein B [bacterium HR40]|nr:Disulfide bond formation protein B [bacterium HR40]